MIIDLASIIHFFIFYYQWIIRYKGQIISKCLFGVFNFFQETNKNTSHSSKKRIHSFVFWKNSRRDNLLLNFNSPFRSSCQCHFSSILLNVHRYTIFIVHIITMFVPNNEAINYLGPYLAVTHCQPIQSLDMMFTNNFVITNLP